MLNSCPVLLKRFLPCLSECVWIHLVSYCDVDDDHLTTSTLGLGLEVWTSPDTGPQTDLSLNLTQR